jgi:hypothetical protein
MSRRRHDVAELIRQYESIGDSCEFGFVQSHFGIDPISLLRWAGCSVNGLVHGLEDGFATLFEVDNLKPGLAPTLVMDREYDLAFHCDLAFDEAGLAQNAANLAAYRRYARDMLYRRRLFHETLRDRNKIFLYSTYSDADMGDLLRLKAALDLQGPQKLLYVVPASPAHPAQDVQLVACGVKIAGMVRTTGSFPADAIDFNAWADICAKAALSDWGHEHALSATAERAAENPPASFPDVMTDRTAVAALTTALYRTLLLRDPDLIGLANMVEAAARKRMTHEQLIGRFLYSLEFWQHRDTILQHYGNERWPLLLRQFFRRQKFSRNDVL